MTKTTKYAAVAFFIWWFWLRKKPQPVTSVSLTVNDPNMGDINGAIIN